MGVVLLALASPAWAQFPTTGLLDDFNRTDADPLDGDWTNPLKSSNSEMELESNEVLPTTTQYCSAYYDVSTYGPDSEVYATIAALPAANDRHEIHHRAVQIGAGTMDAYKIDWKVLAGTDAMDIWEQTDESSTKLGATYSVEMGVGDRFGLESIGDTHKAYLDTGGGFSEIISRSDSSHPAAGYLGIGGGNARTGHMDDFSGGTVVAAGGGPPQLSLMGVGK